MHRILFYSPAILMAAEGEVAHATLDDIRATGKALSTASSAVLLRDASRFNGGLERIGEDYPEAVLLLGDEGDEVFEPIGQAFKEVDVPIEFVALHRPEESGEEEDDSEVDPDDELAKLKARATELGLNFSSQIGEVALRGRVEAEEKRLADEAGGGEGDDAKGEENA
jgi:hypothetical protein